MEITNKRVNPRPRWGRLIDSGSYEPVIGYSSLRVFVTPVAESVALICSCFYFLLILCSSLFIDSRLGSRIARAEGATLRLTFSTTQRAEPGAQTIN